MGCSLLYAPLSLLLQVDCCLLAVDHLVHKLGHVDSEVVVAFFLPEVVRLLDALVGCRVVELEVVDEEVLDVLHRTSGLDTVLLTQKLDFV